MTKIYFFKTVRENGFIKLRALPAQTTYYGYRDINHAVDVNLNVQCTTEARHLQCAYGEGYVFAAKVNGASERATKLSVYSRNGVQFYRLDAMTWPVWYLNGNCSVSYHDENDMPPRDVCEAFAVYRNTVLDPHARLAAPAAGYSQAASSPAVQGNDQTLIRLAMLDEDEINAMAAYVDTGRPLKPTLLKLSTLRDLMAVGVAKFEFIKQNGDHRTAYGTRRPDIISRCPNADGNADRTRDGAHFNYYDMQRRDWRCFCVHDFVDIDTGFLAVGEDQIASMIPAID